MVIFGFRGPNYPPGSWVLRVLTVLRVLRVCYSREYGFEGFHEYMKIHEYTIHMSTCYTVCMLHMLYACIHTYTYAGMFGHVPLLPPGG